MNSVTLKTKIIIPFPYDRYTMSEILENAESLKEGTPIMVSGRYIGNVGRDRYNLVDNKDNRTYDATIDAEVCFEGSEKVVEGLKDQEARIVVNLDACVVEFG